MIIFKKKLIYILGTIIILGVGISRLYLGVHWPVDVIFGWIFGIVFTVIFAKLFDIVDESKNYKILFLVLILFILFIFILKSESYLKILGLLLGLIIGYIIEDKFIKFKTINDYKNEEDSNYKVNNNKNYIVKCAYRFILGIITLGFLYLVLDYVMPENAILSSIKYLIVSLYAIAGVPALFKVVKLD